MMRPAPIRIAAALLGLLLAAGPAAAAPITEYPLPSPGLKPWSIAVDGQGQVWFTLDGPRAIGRLDPTTGGFTQYPAAPGALPYTLKFQGSTLWYTDFELESRDHPGRVIRFDPKTGGTPYALPDPKAGPTVMDLDDQGGLWISEMLSGHLIRLNTQTGAFDPEWQAPATDIVSGQRLPYGQVQDAKGQRWVAESGTNRLIRIGPGDAFQAYTLPDRFWVPSAIALAPNGLIWIAGHATSSVGAFDPATGKTTLWALHTTETGGAASPSDVRIGKNGEVWVMEHSGNRLARILPAEQTVVEYPLPHANEDAQWIAVDAAGNVWYAGRQTGHIGKIGADAPYFTVKAQLATTVRAGGQITGTVTATPHGDLPQSYTYELSHAPQGMTATFDATGHFTLKVDRSQVDPGEYRVLLGVRTDTVMAAAPVTITVKPGLLAQYGWLLAMGAVVIVGGGLIIFLRRRTR